MSGARFLIDELRRARAAAGLSQEDLGKLIKYSGSHVSAVELGTRSPRSDYLAAVDEALHTGGLFLRILREVVIGDAAVPWLRDWLPVERQARSLRWFESTWVPGLLQTEAYARATLAGEMLTSEEADRLVMSRLERQTVLSRDRPPLLIAVIDESILRRHAYHDSALMADQLAHLVKCGEMPNVQIHVVPADVGMYPGLGGGFIIAETSEGGHVAHADSQLAAQIVERPIDVATLTDRWERIRGEALPRRQSLDLIKEAAASWT